jgi:signal transduction histidine kinase
MIIACNNSIAANISSDTNEIKKILEESRKYYSSDFKKSSALAEKAFQLSEKIKYIQGMAVAKIYLGLANYYSGSYDKAIAYYIDAVKIYESINNDEGVAFAYNELSTAYRRYGDIKKAQEYLEKALEIFKKKNNQNGIAQTLDNLGVVYETNQDLDIALKSYRAALNIRITLKDTLGLSYCYANIAGIYMMQKKYDNALKNIFTSLQLREILKDTQALAITLNNIGEIYYDKNDPNNALIYFEKSVALSGKIGYKDLYQYTCNILSDVCFTLKKFEQAYTYQKLSFTIRDSIYNERKNKQIAEIKTKYDTEKKEQDNMLLTEQNKVKDLEIENSYNQKLILVSIIILSVIVFALIFSRSKIKQRELLNTSLLKQERLKNKAIIITQEEERKRIASELHDGIGQMMSAAKLNVASLEDVIEKNEVQKFKTALDLIDESCRELRTISHNMMPGVLIKSGLVKAVKEFSDKINASGKIEINVNGDEEIMRHNELIEINAYRIIQELVNNIIKYANAKSIQISFNTDEKMLSIMIEDDGEALDKTTLKTATGNGWHNINSRINLLKGKIEIDSKPNNGTVVSIDIPLMQYE